MWQCYLNVNSLLSLRVIRLEMRALTCVDLDVFLRPEELPAVFYSPFSAPILNLIQRTWSARILYLLQQLFSLLILIKNLVRWVWKNYIDLPSPPEPRARSSHSALRDGVLSRLSRISIGKNVSYLDGYSSLKG